MKSALALAIGCVAAAAGCGEVRTVAPDATLIDAMEPLTPEGAHHGYVVSNTVIMALDTAPADCMITTAEILEFPLIKQVLLPDSCSADSCAAADSVSIGLRVEAVPATFPM